MAFPSSATPQRPLWLLEALSFVLRKHVQGKINHRVHGWLSRPPRLLCVLCGYQMHCPSCYANTFTGDQLQIHML